MDFTIYLKYAKRNAVKATAFYVKNTERHIRRRQLASARSLGTALFVVLSSAACSQDYTVGNTGKRTAYGVAGDTSVGATLRSPGSSPTVSVAALQTQPQGTASKAPMKERRVIFDEDIYWATSKAAIDKTIARIKSAGFNVYVPCVWHGKGTRFLSSFAPPEERLKDVISDQFDPLAYLIQQAHREGIEVHPWFTVSLRERDFYSGYHERGVPDGAFDVHNLGFRNFIISLMLDVVQRYEIDGINLDYIRSKGFCISERCRDDYSKKHGGTLLLDLATRLTSKDAKLRIVQWNGNAISEIVQRFSEDARRIRPGLVISVDSVPLSERLLLQGQDSVAWVNAGWVDIIFAMEYKPLVNHQRISRARAALNDPDRMTVLFSTFDKIDSDSVKPRHPDVIIRYIEMARTLWPGTGVAFYHYKQLTDQHISSLRETVFGAPAVPEWPTSP